MRRFKNLTSRYREDVIHNTDIVYYKNTDVLEIMPADMPNHPKFPSVRYHEIYKPEGPKL